MGLFVLCSIVEVVRESFVLRPFVLCIPNDDNTEWRENTYIFRIISYASHVPFYSISTLWSFIVLLPLLLTSMNFPLSALIFRLYGRRLLIRACRDTNVGVGFWGFWVLF